MQQQSVDSEIKIQTLISNLLETIKKEDPEFMDPLSNLLEKNLFSFVNKHKEVWHQKKELHSKLQDCIQSIFHHHCKDHYIYHLTRFYQIGEENTTLCNTEEDTIYFYIKSFIPIELLPNKYYIFKMIRMELKKYPLLSWKPSESVITDQLIPLNELTGNSQMSMFIMCFIGAIISNDFQILSEWFNNPQLVHLWNGSQAAVFFKFINRLIYDNHFHIKYPIHLQNNLKFHYNAKSVATIAHLMYVNFIIQKNDIKSVLQTLYNNQLIFLPSCLSMLSQYSLEYWLSSSILQKLKQSPLSEVFKEYLQTNYGATNQHLLLQDEIYSGFKDIIDKEFPYNFFKPEMIRTEIIGNCSPCMIGNMVFYYGNLIHKPTTFTFFIEFCNQYIKIPNMFKHKGIKFIDLYNSYKQWHYLYHASVILDIKHKTIFEYYLKFQYSQQLTKRNKWLLDNLWNLPYASIMQQAPLPLLLGSSLSMPPATMQGDLEIEEMIMTELLCNLK